MSAGRHRSINLDNNYDARLTFIDLQPDWVADERDDVNAEIQRRFNSVKNPIEASVREDGNLEFQIDDVRFIIDDEEWW